MSYRDLFSRFFGHFNRSHYNKRLNIEKCFIFNTLLIKIFSSKIWWNIKAKQSTLSCSLLVLGISKNHNSSLVAFVISSNKSVLHFHLQPRNYIAFNIQVPSDPKGAVLYAGRVICSILFI